MSESKKREVGDIVVFDVTAGGNILPGELKDQLGGRVFWLWVQLDGERATITAVSDKGQYDVTFENEYFVKGIPAEYFADETETPDPAPEEGVHVAEPTLFDTGESESFQEAMDQQMDELEEEDV